MAADGQRHRRVRRGAGADGVGHGGDHRERVPALVVAAHEDALAGDVGHLRAGARVRRAFAMGATHPHEAISTRGKTQSTESIGAELRVNQSLGTRNLWSVRRTAVVTLLQPSRFVPVQSLQEQDSSKAADAAVLRLCSPFRAI